MRPLIRIIVLAAALAVAGPASLPAVPVPTGRYPLFSSGWTAFAANRVEYGLDSGGEIGSERCCDYGRRGIWPAGSADQYIFASGLQFAGIIGAAPGNPWAGDTTMANFFDPSGLRQHGTSVTDIFNALVPTDVADWPAAGGIPAGSEIFPAARQGMRSVSPGDVWWVAWDGDPALNAARPHPLGIAVEYRALGWPAPRGLNDVMFVVATVYNVSASDAAVYASWPAATREMLAELGARFQQMNEEKFQVALPDGGYPIGPLFASFAADPDVTFAAGTNFASVNLPLAMGFAWHPDFPRATGWTFPPEIFGPPFFSGTGLVGTKWLRTPGARPAIQLFSNFTSGGIFPAPNTAARAFKYMAADVGADDGVSCNQGVTPPTDHVCFVHDASPVDIRYMQSAPADTLAPGEAFTIAFAYVHAAPVQIPGYQRGTRVYPGSPLRTANAAQLAQGVNTIDSIAGFLGYHDENGDGQVQPGELTAVRGSLIEKAQLAQAVFDNRFALPEPPAAPSFHLIPGNAEVTIIWTPSPTESTGDPFFAVAHATTTIPAGGGAGEPNPLYDPNYRQFDVEGYRIWRGRSDDPTTMTLLAQYDYQGTVFADYTASVVSADLGTQCAPELGLTDSCPGRFDLPAPGVALEKHVDRNLAWTFAQVAPGDRIVLPGGDLLLLAVDTTVTGGGSGLPQLTDTGVPFTHVDRGLRNGLEYWYAVTTFDVNSIASTGAGRTAMESPRQPQRVVPRGDASTGRRTIATEQGIFGRGGRLTDTERPTIDPITGIFSKRFPPADGVSLAVTGVVGQLLSGTTEVSITFDSSATVGFQPATSIDAVYHYTVRTPQGTSHLRIPVTQSATTGSTAASGRFTTTLGDPARLATLGIPPDGYRSVVDYSFSFPAAYYVTTRSRGCVNHAGGYYSFNPCAYNGPRWFMGEQETVANPNAANPDYFNTGQRRLSFNNVGGDLAGVRTIFEPRAYDDYSNTWRDVEAVLAPFAGAADYRLYWGTNGVVDSVIDLTHDVPVPFAEQLGASWGILNRSATQNGAAYFDQRDVLTVTDAGCLEPLRSLDPGGVACSGPAAKLARHAEPGPIAYTGEGATVADRNSPVAAGEGFVLYLKGHLFMVELENPVVPTAGRSWTMRDYVGAISGGRGRGGQGGDYTFSTQEQPRPLTAVGASVRVRYLVSEGSEVATSGDVARVHTVPDPYYGPTIDPGAAAVGVTFVNLPGQATVRIYSTSGVLLRVLRHDDPAGGGDEQWDLRNRNGRTVASGLYFYHVQAPGGAAAVGRMTIIRR